MDSLNEQTSRKNEEDALNANRLMALKNKAKLLGIKHSGNIGEEALREKINAKMNGEEEEMEFTGKKAKAVAKEETDLEIRARQRKQQMKLVRVRIANMNPSKSDLQGEIVTVGNKFLGSVKKFIPFGEATDDGYHIPFILYEELKTRMFQQISTKRKNGQIIVTTRMVPEYNIQELPQLTRKELKVLADKQGAAERLGA